MQADQIQARIDELERVCNARTLPDWREALQAAHDALPLLRQQQAEIDALKTKIAQINSMITDSVPGLVEIINLNNASSEGDWKQDSNISGITTMSGLNDVAFTMYPWDAEAVVAYHNRMPDLLNLITQIGDISGVSEAAHAK